MVLAQVSSKNRGWVGGLKVMLPQVTSHGLKSSLICMVTPITEYLHQRKLKLRIIGRFGCSIFLFFFRNFKAVLMSFVFKASIQIFSIRFSDFLLLASARAGPEGPAQGWP